MDATGVAMLVALAAIVGLLLWAWAVSRGEPRRRVLALDLDETLVHTPVDAQGAHLPTVVRPGAGAFLDSMARAFDEVVLFTAAAKPYADRIVDGLLDPHGVRIRRRFTRADCTLRHTADGGLAYVKDLRRLGVPLSCVVLLDNTPDAYALQPDNGCPIESFLGEGGDDALARVAPCLLRVAAQRGLDARDALASYHHAAMRRACATSPG